MLTTQGGLSPWLSLPVALLLSGIAAWVIGAITLRLSGHYLPLGTIAWNISFFYVLGNTDALGRYDGLTGLPPITILGHPVLGGGEAMLLTWGFLGICLWLTHRLLRSRTGRAIRALKGGVVAAESFGVDTARVKIVAFVYAAMLAALSGWLYAHIQRAINPTPFGINAGIEYLLMAVIGGAGSIGGGVFGAVLVTVLKDQLQNVLPLVFGAQGNFEAIVFGVLLVLMLQRAPEGLWPLIVRRTVSGPPDRGPAGAPLAPRPAAAPGTALLEAANLRKTFGGLVAVNDIGFKVEAGEVVALIGPNGAGKSTTFNLVTGVARLTSGAVRLGGREVTGLPARRIARLGCARTFQHVKLVAGMSVIENVALGAHLRGSAGPVRGALGLDAAEEAALFAEAERQLARVGLSACRDLPAGSLALGQQRIVEIARALCLGPQLLLLDEPAAGLRHQEKQALGRPAAPPAPGGPRHPARRARHGFRDGARRPAGGDEFRRQAVRGRARHRAPRSGGGRGLSGERRMTKAMLEAENLSVAYGKVEAVRGVSLAVAPGRLVTVLGANGAGKTTLLNALMGVLPARGRILFEGRDLTRLPVEARVAEGLSLIPERRELFSTMTVEDNLKLGAFRFAAKGAAATSARCTGSSPASPSAGASRPARSRGRAPDARHGPRPHGPAAPLDARRAEPRPRPADRRRGDAHGGAPARRGGGDPPRRAECPRGAPDRRSRLRPRWRPRRAPGRQPHAAGGCPGGGDLSRHAGGRRGAAGAGRVGALKTSSIAPTDGKPSVSFRAAQRSPESRTSDG